MRTQWNRYRHYRTYCKWAKQRGEKPVSNAEFERQLHDLFDRIFRFSRPQTEDQFRIALGKVLGVHD